MLEFEDITPEKIILSEICKKRKMNSEKPFNPNYMAEDYYVLKRLKSKEIITSFARKYLNGQILVAIQTLLAAMLTILPLVEIWDLSFVFISIYIYKINKYKNEALEYDRKKIAEYYKNK